MMQWCRSEQLHLFQIQYSYPFLFCSLLGGKNAADLHQQSNSTLGHRFVFPHVVIRAQWIDLGSTTHNTSCSTAWQRSMCHHAPVLSLLMHSPQWLCLEIHECRERAQKPHSVTNTIISSPSLCCCLSAALSCSMSFTRRSQTEKDLPKNRSKHVFNPGSI